MPTVPPMSVHALPNIEATRDLARRVAGHLAVGDVVLFDGELGAGKTTFSRALVEHLGGNPAAVTSPTFTLMHNYEGARIPVVHLDAYRLHGPEGLDGLGFAEASAEAIALVEWAERVAGAFVGHPACWRIRLAHAADGGRTAEVVPPERCAALWAKDTAEVARRPLPVQAAAPHSAAAARTGSASSNGGRASSWSEMIAKSWIWIGMSCFFGYDLVTTAKRTDGDWIVFLLFAAFTVRVIWKRRPLLARGEEKAGLSASSWFMPQGGEERIVAASPLDDSLATSPLQPVVPIILPADADGRDPLTGIYATQQRLTCAFRTLSWPWFFLAVVIAGGAGAAGCLIHGTGGGLAVFGDWSAFLIATAVAAATLSLIGSLRRAVDPRRLPVAQEAWIAAGLVALVYVVLYDPLIGLGVVTGLLCIVYLAAIVFRLLALALGGRRGLRAVSLAAPEGGWPMYTVLVPLYREKDVAGSILRNLGTLDYPRDRLDVKFLLEADDPETLAALQAAGIPTWCEVVIVPHAQPKTKPRACNHGLQRATGDFLVIFDAEDRPEADQLKQAVLAFAQLPSRVACLQAQLAYHNHGQNLLTRWFAMEYNVWFCRYLPGLARLGVPIPLGGTSNHFRTAVLREMGGWDPFNVTEDCDLGVRLHLLGHRTALLDSTTWEEATSVTGNWIRQRSRWLKGYFVTHVVWGRRPLWLVSRLGPWAVWGFLLTVLFVPLLAAVNLILWAYASLYAVLVTIDVAHGWPLWTVLAERDWGHERLSWPMWFAGSLEDPVFARLSQIFFVASLVLLAGNAAFIVIGGLAGRRTGQGRNWLALLLLPAYWFLISLAAWKGLWQALVKPHYWEKTIHGAGSATPTGGKSATPVA